MTKRVRTHHVLPVRDLFAIRFLCLLSADAEIVGTRLCETFLASRCGRYVEFYDDPDCLRVFRSIVRGARDCAECASGVPCAAWAGVDLRYHQPRPPSERNRIPYERIILGDCSGVRLAGPPADALDACSALGLEWPCTRAQMEAAHRALALKHHCHAGGFSDVMVSVNTARDTLRDLLSEETDDARTAE